MSTFTEKIFNKFKEGFSSQDWVLPEERWTANDSDTQSILDLLAQSYEGGIQLKNDEGERAALEIDLFDSFLVCSKKPSKDAKSTEKKDTNALKHLGYSSAEQDLKTLLNLDRYSIKRAVIQSTLKEQEVTKRFKLLLFYLAETNVYNTSWPAKTKQIALNQFAKVTTAISAALLRVTSKLEVASLQMGDKEEQLELYLRESLECQEIYKYAPARDISIERMQLDLVCRKIAQSTQSASILVRFASLTGSVTYLLLAIKLLLRDNRQTLTQEEITCESLKRTDNLEAYTSSVLGRTFLAKKID